MRGQTLEQRREAIRRVAERAVDPGRTEQLRPRALEQIARHDAAARAIFDGLLLHYMEGACKGRLELWAKAAHACIDLIASDRVPFVKRSDLH